MPTRSVLVLMLTALGCAAPALASPPNSGDAPAEEPKDAPEDGESKPEEPPAPTPALDEDGPAHDEPVPDEEPKPEEPKPEEPKPEEPKSEEPGKEHPPKEEPPEEAPPEEAPKPAVPPTVTLSEPEFINGDVPAVVNILKKTLGDVAKCVADHGGLETKEGGLKVQFLVRGRGRAEGVEVLKRHGVSKDAGRCVQALLKNKWVGMPSEDPTGVTFRYDMKK